MQRYLVKRGLVVEKVGEDRKLRQLFLFNDVILCASIKYVYQQRINFRFLLFHEAMTCLQSIVSCKSLNTVVIGIGAMLK
jgi:hypothetical protein